MAKTRGLTNCGLSSVRTVEFNHTRAAGTTVGLVLDFGLFDLADGGEEINQILIAGGPRKLSLSVPCCNTDCWSTHIAHVDDCASLTTRSSEVGEGIGRNRSDRGVVEATAEARGTAVATTETTAKATATTSETASAAEASTATEATIATTTAKAHTRGTCEAVLADFKRTALPLISVELGNSVARIIWGFESDDTGTLGTTGGVGVHIGTNDCTLLGYRQVKSI